MLAVWALALPAADSTEAAAAQPVRGNRVIRAGVRPTGIPGLFDATTFEGAELTDLTMGQVEQLRREGRLPTLTQQIRGDQNAPAEPDAPLSFSVTWSPGYEPTPEDVEAMRQIAQAAVDKVTEARRAEALERVAPELPAGPQEGDLLASPWGLKRFRDGEWRDA